MRISCIVFFCFLLVATVFAQETELKNLEQAFEKSHSELEAAFQKSITKMFDDAAASLDKTLKDLTDRGNLTESLAVKKVRDEFEKERQAFLKDRILEPATIPNPPPKLIPIRNVYTERRTIQTKAENEFKRKAAALCKDHIAELNKIVKETTQTGDLVEAAKIKKRADDLQARLAELSKPTANVARRSQSSRVSHNSAGDKTYSTPNIAELSPEQSQKLADFIAALPGSVKSVQLKGSGGWGGRGDVDQDETRIISSAYDKVVLIHDFDSGRVLGTIPNPEKVLNRVRLHPTKPWLFVASPSESRIVRWDSNTFQKSAEFVLHPTATIQSLDIASDGSFGVAGCSGKIIVMWNPDTGKILDTFVGHDGDVTSVSIHPSGKLIASGGKDKKVILWNIKEKQPLHVFENSAENQILDIVFSPDGSKVAMTGLWGTKYVQIRDVKTGAPWRLIGGYGDDIRSAAFSPDGKFLATGDVNHRLIVWDLAMRKPLFMTTRNSGNHVSHLYYCSKHPNVVVSFSGNNPDVNEFPTPEN